MRRFVLIVSLVVGVLSFAAESWAQNAAAISVSIPPSGRANGMGQAYVALADDGTSSWWNPAGPAFLTEKKDASMTYAKLVPGLADDVFFAYPAFVMPVRQWGGTFTGSLVYLSYGESQATGPTGEDLGTFTSYEIAPTISYGTKVNERIGVGASFKYIRVSLSPDNIPGLPSGSGKGSTFAFDLGGLYKIPGDVVQVGLAIQNLGPDISFVTNDRDDPIYRNLKTGVAVDAYDKDGAKVLVVADVNQLLVKGETSTGDSRYPKPIFNAGVEAGYALETVQIALRGGYVHDDEGSIKDPTYGLGLGYKGISFDFASIPQAKDPETGTRLERVSKFTLGARF